MELIVIARSRDALEATAEEIRRETGVRVTAIAADITTAEGRAAVLAACPEPGHPRQQCGRTADRRLPRLGREDLAAMRSTRT